MLRLYTMTGNSQSIQVKKWLNEHQIIFVERDIGTLTKSELKLILSKTGDGFNEILRSKSKYVDALGDIESLTFEELCSCILEEKNLLKCPILFNGDCVFTGFHADEIRVFIPRKVRQNKRKVYQSRRIELE